MISVVIATHNRHSELKKALESVYAQTFFPYEIIVVDDASTVAVTEEVFSNCPTEIKWTLIRNQCPEKASGARNIGIKNSSGEYIAFLDDDDEFSLNKIHIISRFVVENNFPDVVYHAAKISLVQENISYVTNPKSYSKNEIFKAMLVRNEVGGTPMTVCKRSALLMMGLFDETLPALEDYELWLRMAKMGCSFAALNDILTNCRYLTRTNSVSKNISANSDARKLIYKKYAADYDVLERGLIVKHKEAVEVDELQRYLLNYNYWDALKTSVKIFFISPDLKNLARLFVVSLGSKMSFRVRAWM